MGHPYCTVYRENPPPSIQKGNLALDKSFSNFWEKKKFITNIYYQQHEQYHEYYLKVLKSKVYIIYTCR